MPGINLLWTASNDDDDEARVGEALARTVVCAVKTADPRAHIASWLNTTEVEVTSHETNLHYVNLAVQACLNKRKICPSKGSNLSAWSSSTFKRRKHNSGDGAEYSAAADADPKPALTTSIPFGPNLLPVVRDTGATAQHGVPSDSRETSIALSNNLEANACSGKVDSNSKHTGVHSTMISTDKLLNCLVHPDVISLMTEILLDNHFCH
ncbi:HSPB1-associated protein 1 homolog isoform X2 [Rhincodon typus]|uniref:HSPB1-associated protein 1 homolog isoform X2 n=1 Tax=Rhincodon typus TaxID=259920 RepID=UPI00202E44D5|nr:HSPB1-associated protein 1 homolog isoform X2 [Rhincodon typus]XP_048477358.1 HSPB1-associated protein 1 homolog isoform X2 [Rhincodon typus]